MKILPVVASVIVVDAVATVLAVTFLQSGSLSNLPDTFWVSAIGSILVAVCLGFGVLSLILHTRPGRDAEIPVRVDLTAVRSNSPNLRVEKPKPDWRRVVGG
jgi:putative solute:sodium symporter small subunit